MKTSRAVVSRVMRATTTLSVLPMSKAVGWAEEEQRRRSTGRLLPPLEYDTLIRPSGFLGHGSTRGEHAGRSTLVPTLSPRETRQASGHDSSSPLASLLPPDEDEDRARSAAAVTRGRCASTSAQFFVPWWNTQPPDVVVPWTSMRSAIELQATSINCFRDFVRLEELSSNRSTLFLLKNCRVNDWESIGETDIDVQWFVPFF